MNATFWTATANSSLRNIAWHFYGLNGSISEVEIIELITSPSYVSVDKVLK